MDVDAWTNAITELGPQLGDLASAILENTAAI